MSKLLKEVGDDVRFVKGHQLQPKWYKFAKIFILLGVLGGYYALFGLTKTATFLGIFLLFSLLLHMLYRYKTNKFTRSWLDFIVLEEDGKAVPWRIGAFYYTAIAVSAALAGLVSQFVG